MEGNRVYKNMYPMVAYRKGLATWEKWISASINPRKSFVFFSTTSPDIMPKLCPYLEIRLFEGILIHVRKHGNAAKKIM